MPLCIFGSHQKRLAKLDMPYRESDHLVAGPIFGASIEDRVAGKRQPCTSHRFESCQQIRLIADMRVEALGSRVGIGTVTPQVRNRRKNRLSLLWGFGGRDRKPNLRI